MKFNALVLDSLNEQSKLEVRELGIEDLPEGEVTISVEYSSINFKDAVVGVRQWFVKSYPLVPGIDLAGTVIESKDQRFSPGDPVIATSYGLGTSHYGGFSEIARVPAKWVVAMPEGLDTREAMILGTAGFTAAIGVQKLEDNGLEPDQGEVLVTGATGGVGSIAVDILAKRGYEVVASTGKTNEHDFLKQLGAKKVINREEIVEAEVMGMREERWAGAVDCVGGATLQYILSSLKLNASVATSGFTGGMDVTTTMHPFISRGVNWLGIDSVTCPMNMRKKIWQRLGSDFKPLHLSGDIVNEISLAEIPEVLQKILKGQVRGRTIVKL